MEEQNESTLERLSKQYRLVIMNNETFEEKGSYMLTPLNIYLTVSSVLVLVAVLVFLLFWFTPIHQYHPKFGDESIREDVATLLDEVRDLEERRYADSVLMDGYRRMISGDVVTAPAEGSEQFLDPDSLEIVERIAEDEELRQAVEDDRTIGLEDDRQPPQRRMVNYSPDRRRSIDQAYFFEPVKGTISYGFRPAEKHYGVDIMAPKGTAIKATLDGVVLFSDWTLETGNTLSIQHDNGLISFYKHNSVLLKKSGEKVRAGEAIAIIGNTGELTDGPHLHFELWQGQEALDPTDYISFE